MTRTEYQEFVGLTKYSRFKGAPDNRRETWEEVTDRYLTYMASTSPLFDKERYRTAIENMEIMPSMRAMATAGEGLKANSLCGYNCAFLTVSELISFPETLYALSCGTGVGFSVESEYTSQLPEVPIFTDSEELPKITVDDSREGWFDAYKQLIYNIYTLGKASEVDYSKVRPAGARLRKTGGRASGSAPLKDLFEYTVSVCREAQGNKLTPLQCHDIMCRIAGTIVSGGVRRSALISLSDLDDLDIRKAKSGDWTELNSQRSFANNSAVYKSRECPADFEAEWENLVSSGSGERGIFNREFSERKQGKGVVGTNPCGEIMLKNKQLCNLTEVVIRPEDNSDSLAHKVTLAAELGTFQSTLTNFGRLSADWTLNAITDRLLGVSLTGIYDNPLTYDLDCGKMLNSLRAIAITANWELSQKLRINKARAVTTVKPSGTVSQLANCSSGIHPRHAKFFIRRVRMDDKDPIYKFMLARGHKFEDCVYSKGQKVFSFYLKAPKDCLVAKDVTALYQLKLWKVYADNWTDHNPSTTINVKEGEWDIVKNFVKQNWESIGGLAFLPEVHTYAQPPYEEITEKEYLDNCDIKLNLDKYRELEDGTTFETDPACVGGACELM